MFYIIKKLSTRCIQYFLIGLTVFLAQPVSADEEYGRYSTIILNEGGKPNSSTGNIPRVFIMDSKEGHIWTLDLKTKLQAPSW